jgi:mono/diheme cytochrome c family protein
MIPPRVFVPVVCIATLCIGSLAACTSQQEESASKAPSTNSTPSTAPSVTPAPAVDAAPVAAPVATPAPSAVAAPVASAPTASADTRGLFMTFCAACHGETGDGNGTTKLDRPARSFKDGGFSYGNTPDAIAKTLAYGIPGSVMPSFGKTLTDEQRIALAKYVIELGPQDMPTESPDRVMVVKDRAIVARGKLPPIVEGGEEIPRGLLVGTPDGFTFAYRTDDLRLIAVYQGEFAERTDWMGRGGSQLKPLGKLVADLGAAPRAMFEIPGLFEARPSDPDKRSTPLFARIRSTRSERDRIILAYDLLRDEHDHASVLLHVEESIGSATTSVGSGWRRRFSITNSGESAVSVQLSERVDLAKLGATELEATRTEGLAISGGAVAKTSFVGNGPALVRHWHSLDGRASPIGESGARIEPGPAVVFELVTVIAPSWDENVQKAWEKEVLR